MTIIIRRLGNMRPTSDAPVYTVAVNEPAHCTISTHGVTNHSYKHARSGIHTSMHAPPRTGIINIENGV